MDKLWTVCLPVPMWGRCFWLQWLPNKQLPNILLEGASPFGRAFFFVSCAALSGFTSLRELSWPGHRFALAFPVRWTSH